MYLNVLKRKVLILKFINESNLTGKYIGIKESNCVLLCCQLLSLFFHDLFLIKWKKEFAYYTNYIIYGIMNIWFI